MIAAFTLLLTCIGFAVLFCCAWFLLGLSVFVLITRPIQFLINLIRPTKRPPPLPR